MTVNQLVNQNVESEFIVKEIGQRINNKTSDEELLMWKHVEIEKLVDQTIKQQLEQGEFRPIVVAKLQLRWTWLKQQAIAELEMRGTMEVYSRVR